MAPRLSLVAHSVDVAAVTAALLALPTIRRRLHALAGRDLTALDVQRLVALAFLHDVGKAGLGFFLKAYPDESPLSKDWKQHGHTWAALPLVAGQTAQWGEWQKALGASAISRWGGGEIGRQAVQDLWLAAISHHGEPLTLTLCDGTLALSRGDAWPTWTSSRLGYEPLHGLRQLGDAGRTLFPEAFAADVTPMAPFEPGLVHGFAGLVSLADWIGSNAEESFFPYDLGPQDAARWAPARARAADVLQRLGLDLEAPRQALRQRAPSFQEVFSSGFSPHPAQAACGGLLEERLAVLEAETGSGKTEAALWRFKALFEAGEVDALCFLLPTRVAASGIYERLVGFVERLFPDSSTRPAVVLAVPGYLRANGLQGSPLADFQVLWPDAVTTEQRPRFWAAENSKRYFAGGAVAGTIDQFLLSTLRVKHSHMRASLALRALVVVDEVHASDHYMTTLLRAALVRHLDAGGHALLMSATLTGDARAALLEAALPARQRLGKAPKAMQLLHQHRATFGSPNASYPCLSTLGQGIQRCPASGRRKAVHFECVGEMADPRAVAARAWAAAQQGARVLVLRNSVRQAIATQQALETVAAGNEGPAALALFECGGVIALHHGRYAAPDRQKLDARVEQLYGKSAASSTAARILVATQTIEISVDCDADVLITDLAPMDVLLQRIGRLHRHAPRDAHRPAAFRDEARVIVLTPAERDLSELLTRKRSSSLGIGPYSAYDNVLTLEATWQALERASAVSCMLPDANRVLVESSLGVEVLNRLALALGPAWQEHLNAVCGKKSAAAMLANSFTVSWSRPWDDAGSDELDAAARTRLGLDGVEIELPSAWTTPFGSRVKSLSVPQWMLRGEDATLSYVQGDHASLRFTVGEIALRYDRWGLYPA